MVDCQPTAKISVIVPIYNTSEYLPRCVDSIINQGYDNLEVILVDDGSTDLSPTICDNFAKKDVKIKVIHKQNEGQAVARNTGILAATGGYIEFVDSDDYLQPDTFTTFDNAIRLHPDVDIFTANYRGIEAKRVNNKSLYIKDTPGSGYDFLKYRLKQDKYPTVASWLYVIRRDFILRHNLFFEKGFPLEDLLWSRQIFLSNSKVLTLNFTHYNYIIRLGSTTQSTNKVPLGECRIKIFHILEQASYRLEDLKLKKLLHNDLIGIFMKAFIELHSSNNWNDYKHLFDKKYIKGRAITAHNRYKVFLYSIHPTAYFHITILGRKIMALHKKVFYR